MPFKTRSVSLTRVDDLLWELIDPLLYEGKDEAWTVPAGFQTDFASVPQFVTWLIPRTGTYTLAAILHDWFCAVAIQTGIISARDADGVFRRVMREEGVPLVRRWLMWTGVRWAALFNHVRRADWKKDAVRILLISLLALPVVAPAAILVGVTLLVDRIVEAVTSRR